MLGNHRGQWCRDFLPKNGWIDGIDTEIDREDAYLPSERYGTVQPVRMLSGTVGENEDGSLSNEYFEAGSEDCPYYTFRVLLGR